MYKVYLNNKSHWFPSQTQRDWFMQVNPIAKVKEFTQYWDRNTKSWLNK